eukprot:jgi/Psemu1/12642/gm1.12642_g
MVGLLEGGRRCREAAHMVYEKKSSLLILPREGGVEGNVEEEYNAWSSSGGSRCQYAGFEDTIEAGAHSCLSETSLKRYFLQKNKPADASKCTVTKSNIHTDGPLHVYQANHHRKLCNNKISGSQHNFLHNVSMFNSKERPTPKPGSNNTASADLLVHDSNNEQRQLGDCLIAPWKEAASTPTHTITKGTKKRYLSAVLVIWM